MQRREFLGSVLSTTLSANISNSASNISAVDASTFPDGASGKPFVIVISRGAANEEKILISSRASNTFTVMNRGYDGTVANAHTVGAVIDHVLDANTIQDMNNTTYDNEINLWMGI